MARRGGASRFRFRMLPSIVLTVAILVIPAALYAYGRQADAFTIDKVVVGGTQRVPRKEAARLLRKAFTGRNLFTVTSADVRDALDQLCYLAAVEVDRDFPTTLRVRVIEYRPLLYVLAGGRWYLLADTGHVICAAGTEQDLVAQAAGGETVAEAAGSAEAAEAAGGGVAGSADEGSGAAVAAALRRGPAKMKPVLPRMATVAVPKVGATVGAADVLVALRVVAALPASLRARVAVVRVDDEAQVTLDLDDGLLVRLGGQERLRAKVLSLKAVLAAYRRGHVTPTMVDVSAPDRPLARPRLSP